MIKLKLSYACSLKEGTEILVIMLRCKCWRDKNFI